MKMTATQAPRFRSEDCATVQVFGNTMLPLRRHGDLLVIPQSGISFLGRMLWASQ